MFQRKCAGVPSSLFVNLRRIEDALADHNEFAVLIFAEEAGVIAFVAGGSADLFDLENDRIEVAVDINFLDFLDISGFLAFSPEFLTGAGPVGGVAGLQGFVPGLDRKSVV